MIKMGLIKKMTRNVADQKLWCLLSCIESDWFGKMISVSANLIQVDSSGKFVVLDKDTQKKIATMIQTH